MNEVQKFNKYDFDVTTGFKFEIDFPLIDVESFGKIILLLTNYKSSKVNGVVDFETVVNSNKIVVYFDETISRERASELLNIITDGSISYEKFTITFIEYYEVVRFNGMYDLEQQRLIKDSSTARLIGNGDDF